MRRTIFKFKHAYLGQRFINYAVELFATKPHVVWAEGDIFPNSRHKELVIWILKDDSYLCANLLKSLFVFAINNDASDSNLTLHRWMDAIHMHNERCLAGSIWPKERNALTLVDTQIDSKERLISIGICEGELFNLQARYVIHHYQPITRKKRDRESARPGSESAVAHWRCVALLLSSDGRFPSKPRESIAR